MWTKKKNNLTLNLFLIIKKEYVIWFDNFWNLDSDEENFQLFENAVILSVYWEKSSILVEKISDAQQWSYRFVFMGWEYFLIKKTFNFLKMLFVFRLNGVVSSIFRVKNFSCLKMTFSFHIYEVRLLFW